MLTGPKVTEYRYPNGDPCNTQHCLTPQEQVDHFTICVRSLNGIGVETLRDLIQTRFKVDQIAHERKVIYSKDRR